MSRASAVPLSLGALIAATACGRSAPRPAGAEAGADPLPRCSPRPAGPTASAATEPRRRRLDWNGDGIDDLALSTAGGVAIWLGSRAGLGDGPAIRLPAPADSDGFGDVLMPIGDLDADGFGDLVVAAPSTITARERGDRGGPDAPAPERLAVLGASRYFGASLGAGDLDGDGRPELVAATPSSMTTTVQGRRHRWRAGLSVYGADLVPHALWSGEPDVGHVLDLAGGGDLDGDGCDDVVVRVERAGPVDAARSGELGFVSPDRFELRVYTGGPGGLDAARSRLLARGAQRDPPRPLVLPDFEGDRRGAVAFASGRGVSIARFDPAGAAAPAIELSFPVESASIGYLATGDFDGDGRRELLAGSHTHGLIAVYRGGAPAVAPIMLSMPPDARLFPLGLSVGDFDGNGRDDLAATGSGGSATPDRLWIYRADATSLLGPPLERRLTP